MSVFPIVRHGYHGVLLGVAMAMSFLIEFKHHYSSHVCFWFLKKFSAFVTIV